MAHPKGSIVYNPGGRFCVPRHYVSQLFLHIESHLTYSISVDEITFLYSPIPLYRAYLKFKDEFWNFSSNAYTLDFIVEWNYQTSFPGDAETTFFLGVAYSYDAGNCRHSIDLTTVLPSLDSVTPLPPPSNATWIPLDEGCP